MEMEYKDPSRRGRWIVLLGVVLALVAGAAAFYLLNNATQLAGQATAAKIPAVVAIRPIAARQEIAPEDVAVREVPVDGTNANGVVSDPALVVGRIAAVAILEGQLVTSNLLASSTAGAPFSILGPDETVGPDSEAWRAVAVTVPDDLAVGGMLNVGDTVDLFVTAVVSVDDPTGRYISERSTKITYQNVVILARDSAFYVIRTSLAVAEEIAHLQATGAASFSFALRPVQDQRLVDTSGLGETTNRIIERYGLPIPEPILPGSSPAPTRSPTPAPSASAAPSPSATP